MSKDRNLTKAHIRYLEGRLIDITRDIGRVELSNNQASGSKLPESDQADMEVFLSLICLVLPVMGSDMLTPVRKSKGNRKDKDTLYMETKGVKASGMRTPSGFVVLKGSQAVLKVRPSFSKTHPGYLKLRDTLLEDGDLEVNSDYIVFTKDVEFSSPSAAGAVIVGGGAAGPQVWKDNKKRTLQEIENL